MKVVFLKQWRGKRPGAVADVPDGAANVLCKRKVCQLYGEERGYETAACSPPEKRVPGRSRKCL